MGRLDELERDRQIAEVQAMLRRSSDVEHPHRDAGARRRDAERGASEADAIDDADDAIDVRELTGFGDGFAPPRAAWKARMLAHKRSVVPFVGVAVVAAVVTGLIAWFLRPVPSSVAARPTIASADERGDKKAGSAAGKANSPPGGPAEQGAATSSPKPTTIVVAVVGQVVTPGLVTLPEGSRVSDAITAAGGALPGADLSTVNLARKLADGEQISVGVPAAGPGPATGPPGSAAGSAPAAPSGQPVNINTADVATLDSLPGVGPVIAQRIVDYRTEHGKFTSTDELANVSGIGPSIMEKIKDKVTV